MTDERNIYRSPLGVRYACRQMLELFGERRKFSTWRRIWLALALAQKELGLDISQQQIEQMSEHLDDIDFDQAGEYERKFRHDVMAHVHAFGDAAPLARPIIHLGATSQDIVDNTDLIIMREALELIRNALVNVIDALADFADEHRELPCLGFTH